MKPPETISINLNAADGIQRFREIGEVIWTNEQLNANKITALLTAQKGRLFRLLGWIEDSEPALSVIMKIEDSDGHTITLSNDKPPFEGVYTVANEPPPRLTIHGDYQFRLNLQK